MIWTFHGEEKLPKTLFGDKDKFVHFKSYQIQGQPTTKLEFKLK